MFKQFGQHPEMILMLAVYKEQVVPEQQQQQHNSILTKVLTSFSTLAVRMEVPCFLLLKAKLYFSICHLN